MKEFDKWFENEFNKDGTLKSEDKHYRWRTRDKWAEDAWKAALEWTLEQDTWIGSDEDGEWGIDKDEIKGELNGET